MDDTTYRLLDISLKLLTALSVAAGGGWALVGHLEKARRESAATFRKHQIDLYLETAKLVGAIAAAQPSAEREELEARFWSLYYGAFAVVQEVEVTDCLVEFARALRKERAKTTLRAKSLAFAGACRRSIEKTWRIELLPLSDKYALDAEHPVPPHN